MENLFIQKRKKKLQEFHVSWILKKIYAKKKQVFNKKIIICQNQGEENKKNVVLLTNLIWLSVNLPLQFWAH